VSGAAGSYIVTLAADPMITAHMIIQPGQAVHMSADASRDEPIPWHGGFRVLEQATLTLKRVSITGYSTSNSFVVDHGGYLSATDSMFACQVELSGVMLLDRCILAHGWGLHVDSGPAELTVVDLRAAEVTTPGYYNHPAGWSLTARYTGLYSGVMTSDIQFNVGDDGPSSTPSNALNIRCLFDLSDRVVVDGRSCNCGGVSC
jgi:hypothetical protein